MPEVSDKGDRLLVGEGGTVLNLGVQATDSWLGPSRHQLLLR